MKALNSTSTKVERQWVEKIRSSYKEDERTHQLIAQALLTLGVESAFSVKDGILKYNGRIWIGSSNSIRLKIVEAIHNSSLGGHSGMQASYRKAKGLFYWMGMKDLEEFISACDICKKMQD